MLRELIAAGYGEKEDYNCAEKIFRGANTAYGLGLGEEALRLAGGFGGGLGIESCCGALCAGVMVLSCLLVKTTAHQSGRLKPEERNYLEGYKSAMGSIYCDALKRDFRTPEKKCRYVIEKAAEHLDEAVNRIRREDGTGWTEGKETR